MAMKQLPKGHDSVQQHCGSDHLEVSFGESCGKNAQTTAQGTDDQMAGNMGSALKNVAASEGANCGK